MKFLKEKFSLFDVNAYDLRGKDFYKSLLVSREKALFQHKDTIQDLSCFQCPLCNHKESEILLEWEQNYSLLTCKHCGAVSPNISIKDVDLHINSVYSNEDYFSKVIMSIHNQYEYRKKIFGINRYEYIFSRLNLDSKSVRLLDVGCGAGYFLSVLKDKGVESKGLEVAPHLVEYCKKMGLNVFSNGLSEEEDESYDVITLFDVIEHLSDPIVFFKNIRKKLKNNGYCIVFTPNIESVGFELMGAKQNLLVPFEHVCFYNEQALNYLSQNSNLIIFSKENYGLDIMDYLLMKEYEDDIKYTVNLHDMIVLVQAIIDKAKLSNHYRITFQKN